MEDTEEVHFWHNRFAIWHLHRFSALLAGDFRHNTFTIHRLHRRTTITPCKPPVCPLITASTLTQKIFAPCLNRLPLGMVSSLQFGLNCYRPAAWDLCADLVFIENWLRWGRPVWESGPPFFPVNPGANFQRRPGLNRGGSCGKVMAQFVFLFLLR